MSNFYIEELSPYSSGATQWLSADAVAEGYVITDSEGNSVPNPDLIFYSSIPPGGIGLTLINSVQQEQLNLWGSMYVGSDGNYYANVGPKYGNNPIQQIGGPNAASGVTAAQIPSLIDSAHLREQQAAAAQAAEFNKGLVVWGVMAGAAAVSLATAAAQAAWVSPADVAPTVSDVAPTVPDAAAAQAAQDAQIAVATANPVPWTAPIDVAPVAPIVPDVIAPVVSDVAATAVPDGMTLVNGMLVPNSILAQGAIGSSMDIAANAAAASATASASVMSAADLAAINAAASWMPSPASTLAQQGASAISKATGGLVTSVPQAAGYLATAIKVLAGKGAATNTGINPATGLPYGVASTAGNAQTLQSMLPVLAIGAVALILLNRR